MVMRPLRKVDVHDRLSKEPHVVAAAPAIFEQVLISRGPRARGAVLKGMIPRYERRVGDLLNSVKEGSSEDLSAKDGDSENRAAEAAAATRAGQSPDSLAGVEQRVAAMPPIVLGKDMADNLGATVGSVVLVTSPQGELTPFGTVPKYTRFRVVGIFSVRVFRLRLQLGFRAPLRRAAIVRAGRSDLGHGIQGR
jgi:lipoprotein-releasing system permease protein